MKNEKEMRHEIARTLGDLAEFIIKRKPPCDKVPLQPETTSDWILLHGQFQDALGESLGDQLVDMAVSFSRYCIATSLTGEAKPFLVENPIYTEVEKTFRDWFRKELASREQDVLRVYPLEQNLKVSKVIKQVVKERNPEFLYDKEAAFYGMIPFSKPFSYDNMVYLFVDRGTKRRALSFGIGLQKPGFHLDIGCFFGGTQSWYRYSSASELSTGMRKGLDTFNSIMPFLSERMKQILEP